MNNYKIDRPEDYFSALYEKYGIDERALGWSKHKQNYRFYQVSKYIRDGNSILDIGCGFADLYGFLKNKYTEIDYYGIDVMKDFIEVAVSKYEGDDLKLCHTDFNSLPWDRSWDWIVECGLFGLRLFDDEGMYEYIERTLSKAIELSRVGVSFNFMSDKVDYKTSDSDFHVCPEKILAIAYKYSRRVILDNSILPFEYSITLWKNDTFLKETTVFNDVEEIR